MKALGPIWALALTLDRDVAAVLVIGNILFSIAFSAFGLRGRGWLDRFLMTVGLFAVLTVGSTIGMYTFARTPVRDVQFFAVE